MHGISNSLASFIQKFDGRNLFEDIYGRKTLKYILKKRCRISIPVA
jgi:hypothetical protein